MNYTAIIALGAGGILLLIGIRGTQTDIWQAITGQSATTPTPSGTHLNSLGIPVIGASGTFGTPTPSQYTGYQAQAYRDAQDFGINPTYFVNQINAESGFNPNALSPAGAEGIAQIMPSTAKGWNVNPWNPTQALQAAARAMANYIQQFGGEAQALAAYNAGPGAVQQAVSAANAQGLGGNAWENYLPVETQSYIKKIMG